MLGTLGWEELVLILAIVALIAGGGRVADLGGSLGRGVREFRRGVQGDDVQPAGGDPTPPPTPRRCPAQAGPEAPSPEAPPPTSPLHRSPPP